MTKLFHIQNLASAGTFEIERPRRRSAQSWSAPVYHIFSPLCGSARVTTLSGRLTLMPSCVPFFGREVWPTLTVEGASPGFTSTGSTQPSTHLSQRPMWVGIDWKIGPECEPELMRSQKSTSELAAFDVSYRSGR